jgi:membrane fusion protein, heavy metal efflux system
MYANMTLITRTRDVMVVPSTAVIRNGNETFVFVETAPGKYDHRNVTLDGTDAENDEVTQGLIDGDKVVTTGAELLREAEGQ